MAVVQFRGDTYLNCYDSIKYYYSKGLRLFELDVEYTSDHVPVLLHSWDGFQYKYLGIPREKVASFEEFSRAKMKNDYTQLSLESLAKLMENEFSDMFFVTDTKENNIELLSIISSNYKAIKPHVIPQVYNQDEYFFAKELGFENIIYTLYMSEDTDDEVINFCKENDVFAITMPLKMAQESALASNLKEKGVFVYTHTVNNKAVFEELKSNGIQGIYTDYLTD